MAVEAASGWAERALAAEVYNAAKPYGRMFVATGNGSYGINSPTISGQPYSNPTNSYGMSVLDLDLTLGQMTIEDEFTPYNEALLNAQDGDLGSGGPILVPTQTLGFGEDAESAGRGREIRNNLFPRSRQ